MQGHVVAAATAPKSRGVFERTRYNLSILIRLVAKLSFPTVRYQRQNRATNQQKQNWQVTGIKNWYYHFKLCQN